MEMYFHLPGPGMPGVKQNVDNFFFKYCFLFGFSCHGRIRHPIYGKMSPAVQVLFQSKPCHTLKDRTKRSINNKDGHEKRKHITRCAFWERVINV